MKKSQSIEKQFTEFQIRNATQSLKNAVYNYLFITRPSSKEARESVGKQVVADMVKEYYVVVESDEE